jgi:hypothetical protein
LQLALVNEKFAFDFGLALMGIDTFQIDEGNSTAKHLAEQLCSSNC